jgi:hypothetical protein
MGIDAVLANLEIRRILLGTHKRATRIEAGDSCCATPKAVVQNGITFVGIGLDEIFHQGDGFLSGMETTVIRIAESQDALRVIRTVRLVEPLVRGSRSGMG